MLGELRHDDPEVLSVLRRTVNLFRNGTRHEAHAAWQASFALMKLGGFGKDAARDRNLREPVDYLIRHLPEGHDLGKAMTSLGKTLRARGGKAASIDERDVVAIARHAQSGMEEVVRQFEALRRKFDLVGDKLGRRAYFMAWLCGYLRVADAADDLVRILLERSGSVCSCAAEALGRVASNWPVKRVVSAGIVQALENLLQARHYRTRYHAACSLVDVRSTGSIPTLESAARWEPVASVRQALDEARRRLQAVRTGQRTT